MKAWKHFKTITKHKIKVGQLCFRIGLYKQGILHDMSKYSLCEFLTGARYYQGTKSPNAVERTEKGYSMAWLHHKGRNKHHYEYWIDYGLDGKKALIGMKMPKNYVVEMVLDRIAASKVYKGDAYKDSDPLEYFTHGGTDGYVMHEDTKALLEKLLRMLADKGEAETFEYIKKVVLKDKNFSY